ncbi:MAG: hypothetical protein ACF8XB_18945, partial [Planctomycetota bacterium JB042]
VTAAKVADGAVLAAELQDDSIGAAAVAGLTSGSLASNAAGSAEVAADAVDTAAIQDGAVTGAKVAADTVTDANVDDDSLTANSLATGSVGADELAGGAVGAAELQDDSIGTLEVLQSTIVPADLDLTDDDWKFLGLQNGARIGLLDFYSVRVSTADSMVALIDNDDDDSDSGVDATFEVRHNPDEGLLRVRENGDLEHMGTTFAGSMTFDIAEFFPTLDSLEPGTVVVAVDDATMPGRVEPSSHGVDPAVVGVVTTNPGIILGGGFSDELYFPELTRQERAARAAGAPARGASRRAEIERGLAALPRSPIALKGRVPVRVTAEAGPIRVGDLLTTANTPGCAMRYVPGSSPTRGVVLGKALESLRGEEGEILVLVGNH